MNFKFSKSIRAILIIGVIAFLAVGCQKKQVSESANKQISQTGSQQTKNEQSVISKLENKTRPEDEPKMISVTQAVEGLVLGGEEANFSVAEGINALLLLKMGVKNVETKTFSGIGEYVTSINGEKEDSGKNFWAFYINGKQSKIGAGDYKLKNGDKIIWKLEVIK